MSSSRSSESLSKLMAMAVLLSFDLGLNCSLDYDAYNSHPDQYPSNFLLGLVGLQVIVQITVFLLLFLAMADTFLFRVGLLGLLLKKFRFVLLFHPVYIAFTLASGLVRVRLITNEHYTLAMLWNNYSFVVLSSIQKICKVV